jgi:uncharacterized integral membrane protein (TIGR00698 family)
METWEKLLLGVPLGRAHLLLPGVGLALLVTLAADRFSHGIGLLALRLQGIASTGRPSPISAMTCSVLIGLTLGNSVGVRSIFRPGVDFSVKKLLRLGIILVGLRLSLLDVMRLGIWGIPVVMLVIVSALFLTNWISKWLGLSARLGALAAASTAICGVTAAMAVAPLIDADEQELAYTVANVTIFGMLAMLVYPYLAHFLFGQQSGAIGLFLGTAIHDTSQVMGAALAYKDVFGDELALKIATVTKLTRNVFLAAVVPILSLHFARKAGRVQKRVNIANLLPLFVLGFLAMAILRSAGDAGIVGQKQAAFGVWGPAAWAKITQTLGDTVATVALGAAMASVGLSTNLKALRRLGIRPLYLGAAAATIVSGVGLLLATLVGPHIHRAETAAAIASAPRSVVPATPPSPLPLPAAPKVEEPAPAEVPAPPAPSSDIDSDGDGITDAKDACTGFAGPARDDQAKTGCPTVRIDNGKIIAVDPVTFRRHKAAIPRAAKPALFAVLNVLRGHDEIRRISVDGYVNEWRSHKRNAQLARRRAAAVARWLTVHHVARSRVRFRGFAEKPSAGATSHGPGRIEFRIARSG